MKHCSGSRPISYDVIILISYSQCRGNNLTAFKDLVLWGLGFKKHKILSSQASARSSIDIENLASSLTAQSAFLNNFENVNPKVDIQEDVIDTKTLSDQIKELVVERISSLKEKIRSPKQKILSDPNVKDT